MTEHIIRLRGGWETDHPLEGHPARFLTLRLKHPRPLPSPIELIRRFSSPRIELDREVVILKFEDVEGLEFVRLNDRTLDLPDEIDSDFVLELEEPLRPRNELRLGVRWPDNLSQASKDTEWGNIALVIVPR